MRKQSLGSGTPVVMAHPAGNPRRGVVVVPDIGGLSANFERIAAHLATHCDAAVAVVEPFPHHQHLSFDERLATALGELREDVLIADAVETAALLEVDPIAVLGVCIGGAMAVRATTTGRFDRVVSLYGMVHFPPAWTSHKGDPLEAAKGTSVPILTIVGTDDQFVSEADLAELEDAGATVERVSGAKHGFAHDPSLPSHDPNAAAMTWDRVVEFLGEGLQA